jgi:hypothetical protein
VSHVPVGTLLFYSEDGGSKFIRNAVYLLTEQRVSRLKRFTHSKGLVRRRSKGRLLISVKSVAYRMYLARDIRVGPSIISLALDGCVILRQSSNYWNHQTQFSN